MQIIACELPLKWGGDLLVVLLEAENAISDLLLGAEIVRCERLALQDREVDFDLIEPARMDGQVNEDELGPLLCEPVNGALAAMNGAVVDHPEHPFGAAVRVGVHDFGNESIECSNGRLGNDVTEEPSTMDVPSGVVGTGSMAGILMLDPDGAACVSMGSHLEL